MSRTVLLVHGAFAGGWIFARLGQRLTEAGFRVIAHDLPLHGKKRPTDGGQALGRLSLTDYLSDLLAVTVRLDRAPIVIGHSLGGLLAQQLAALDRARAAVLLGPVAPWGVFPATTLEVLSALGLYRAGSFWDKTLWPDWEIARGYSLDKFERDAGRQAFDQLGPESGRVLFEVMHWGLDSAHASAVDARRVACPILCLAGSDDRVCSPGTVRSIAHRYRRHATYDVIPGLSHFMFGEPAEGLMFDRIFGWLAENRLMP
jgi:pimeloyl-ACP methyl ester carboxylesterase